MSDRDPIITQDEPSATTTRRTERRTRTRATGRLPDIAPALPTLDDYAQIVGASEIDELRGLAKPLRTTSVKMINGTSIGGGAAETLNRLIPLLNELDVRTRWDVVTGGNDFYEVTRAFNNALSGGDLTLSKRQVDIFMMYSEENRRRIEFNEDVVVVHDAQPLGLIRSRQPGHGHWVWRCNLDLSHPNPNVWGLLRPFVERYDAAVFSAPSFARQLSIPGYLFYSSIDPLSDKNRELDDSYVQQVCDDFGIDRKRPVIAQISRFDRLKDPVGVIEAYKLAKKYVDCQLVLAGGGATEDAESSVVLQEVMDAAGEDPDIIILNLPPWSALEINALQRASTIIIQKSIQEGFGLTVTEALWKAKPVIANAVGGIPTQIVHKFTGLLVHSIEGCAYQIRYLLTHPEFAAQLGQRGREHVQENFLVTSSVRRWLLLCQVMLGITKPVKIEAR
jgi:trehalose synthase